MIGVLIDTTMEVRTSNDNKNDIQGGISFKGLAIEQIKSIEFHIKSEKDHNTNNYRRKQKQKRLI